MAVEFKPLGDAFISLIKMTTSRHRLVVIAEFKVKPGAMAAFLELAHDDACCSVADEPGCRAFDVAVAQDDPDTVVFYEVYDDRAAFDAHLQMPHLARFRAAFPALIVTERAVTVPVVSACALPRLKLPGSSRCY
jgi:quinol monooxygenase YgiN